MLALVLLGLVASTVIGAVVDKRRTDEYCLKSALHKEIPSPEESLYGECAQWKNNSCCNWNTSVEVNKLNLNNFDYDHCLEQGKPSISEGCRRYFILDLCFIECSPDLGFWVVPDDHMKRIERVSKVPLCKSECDAWFEACKNDFTCTSDWSHSFDWSDGRNKCLLGKSCRTIFEEFQTAKNFCERVWDGSWQYTDNSLPCMNLTFDVNEPSPNIQVAQFYSQAKCSACRESIPHFFEFTLFLAVSLFSLMYS